MLDCVACKEKIIEILYYFTYFYIIYDFIIVQLLYTSNQLCIKKQQQIKYNQREREREREREKERQRDRETEREVYFSCIVPYVCFAFLSWIKVISGCFRRPFFIWETKNVVAGRVRHVVVLYSNDCTGFACVDSVLVVVLERFNRFHCDALS